MSKMPNNVIEIDAVVKDGILYFRTFFCTLAPCIQIAARRFFFCVLRAVPLFGQFCHFKSKNILK
jgi:hypothetical protein